MADFSRFGDFFRTRTNSSGISYPEGFTSRKFGVPWESVGLQHSGSQYSTVYEKKQTRFFQKVKIKEENSQELSSVCHMAGIVRRTCFRLPPFSKDLRSKYTAFPLTN